MAVISGLFIPAFVFFGHPVKDSRKTALVPAVASPAPASVGGKAVPEIWLVEAANDAETYSNGLRIETRFAVTNRPRNFTAFPVAQPDETSGERRSQPAGIVFHTTESLQIPFEALQNSALKRISESLLDYIRRKRAYNFLIDRFGRVYRVVVESDAADHAGHSVWRDERWFYVNLNESFLGVSFETETHPGQMEAAINPAQGRSAALLTDMLRGRYGIPAGNCVTHAQVSVNPSNMRVGYHTDWASSFPFEQLGLPDNYNQPLPALSAFGFSWDSSFVSHTGGRMYRGVQLAEELLQHEAAAVQQKLPEYRRVLQARYRRLVNIQNKTQAP